MLSPSNLPSESGPLKWEHVSAMANRRSPRRTSRIGTPWYIARVGVLSGSLDSGRTAVKFSGNVSPRCAIHSYSMFVHHLAAKVGGECHQGITQGRKSPALIARLLFAHDERRGEE